MSVPPTNLFKGDRVKLSRAYIVGHQLRNKHAPVGRWVHRRGVIISDTLDPTFNVINVHWDGCKKTYFRRDRGYLPDDLELVED